MLFTVVIPAYNSSGFIRKTIDSIRESYFGGGYEVIVVDDCSDDLERLELLVEAYPECRIIKKSVRTNAADSRNIGFLESRSDFVFFIDSDDCFLPGAIVRRLGMHLKLEVGLIFGRFLNGCDGGKFSLGMPKYVGGDIRDFLFLKKGDFRSSTISIYKGFYNGSLFDRNSFKHQDWIFGIICGENLERIHFDDVPSVLLNIDRSGRMSSTMNLDASNYFCKNYLVKQSHINSFSRGVWLNVVELKDYVAAKYFLSIYSPVSFLDFWIKFVFLLASSRLFGWFFSVVIKIIRRLRRLIFWRVCEY